MNTLTEAQRERVLALLAQGKSLRQIEDVTGHRRETIAAYGRRAGLLGQGVANLDSVREPASVCEPLHDVIASAVESGSSLRAIHGDLETNYGFIGSYSSLKRYVRMRVDPTQKQALLVA